MDYELTLFDRIEVIKTVNKKYDLEHNAYLSFSGGKDSTILHYLLDKALPKNRIPRVFINTGIEYQAIVEFVKGLVEKDDRFILLKPSVAVKPMLEKYGYPFKSKQHDLVQWGNKLHMCVGTMGYGEKMSKGETIILGVFLQGQIVECCQIGLSEYDREDKEMKVLQLRGDHNTDSPYHNECKALTNQFLMNYKPQNLMGAVI